MIPPFELVLADDEIERTATAVTQILRDGVLLLGPATLEFEQEFARLVGGREVVAVNTGTVALEIILRTIVVSGREVLLPTNTNYGTAKAVLAAGGVPVFYDGGLYFSRDAIEELLTPRTAAVIVVHIAGHISPDIFDLAERLRMSGIPLVEDAAHAHGSRLGEHAAGTIGNAAAFSFFPTKVITTLEGGAVVAATGSAYARNGRILRNQGKNNQGCHVLEGGSWRMTEVGAALGSAQLRNFDSQIAFRRSIIDQYRSSLSDVAQLTFPAIAEDEQLSGHKAVATLRDPTLRGSLRKSLGVAGVSLAGSVYELPLHRQPVFEDLAARDYPLADEFAATHICLPLWSRMPRATADTVAEAVATALSGT